MIQRNDESTANDVQLRALIHHVKAWLIRQGASPVDAETATTDLVTEILRKHYLRSRLDNWAENSPLFCQHAKWRWLDLVRAEKRRRRREKLQGEVIEESDLDDSTIQGRLWPAKLEQLLTAEQLEVLELHYATGYSPAEMAATLGIGERAIRGRLERARATARTYYIESEHPAATNSTETT